MDNNLRKIRISQGVSITELSRSTGLSRTAIYNIENGQGNPLYSTIETICLALKRSPNEIFFTHGVIRELQRR